jgi:hypothetical protein
MLTLFLIAALNANGQLNPETAYRRGAAEQDLKAIHDDLNSSSPAPYVARDSAIFSVGWKSCLKMRNAISLPYMMRAVTTTCCADIPAVFETRTFRLR